MSEKVSKKITPKKELKKPFDLEVLKQQLSKPSKPKAKKLKKKKIVYEDSIVAFIDILGFKESINKSKKSDAIKMIEKLEWIFDKVISTKEFSKVKINYFSDCVCLSEALPKENSEEYLDTVFMFLVGLEHIQGEMIFQDIIIRGGVSIDKHYSTEKLIFSKGLLKSYEIESKKAVNPVIMIDESVYKKLVEFHRKKTGTYANKHHYLSKINDLLSLSIELPTGEHVLNYLSFWREVDDPSNIIPYFKKHKKIIENEAQKNKKNASVLSKYKWMAEYHNYYLKKIYQLQTEVEPDLLINIEEVFTLFSQPKI